MWGYFLTEALEDLEPPASCFSLVVDFLTYLEAWPMVTLGLLDGSLSSWLGTRAHGSHDLA